MDITKLMIGDWVWCGSNYGKVAQIFILHDSLLITVNNRRNKYFEEVNPFEITTDAEDIRPIPLTTEIIEKNMFKPLKVGFEPKNLVGKWCYKNGEVFVNQYCFSNESYRNGHTVFMVGSSSYIRIGDIVYVHQLQHALRICGIEKEIIL